MLVDTEVRLGRGRTGGDLVYRPELLFLRAERWARVEDRIAGAPDLVVEVVRLIEVPVRGLRFRSLAVPGFALDLARVRLTVPRT